MGYAKKKFEGNYLNWYNIISANRNVPEIIEYSPVNGQISALDWKGENKEAVCSAVKALDATCQSILDNISSNIEKIKTCTGPLFSELEGLKNKIEEYNGYVDDYDYAIMELNKKNEEKKQNKEVS